MIALFQAALKNKPLTRAIHKFNQSTTAKWVPVNKSFVTLCKIILTSAVGRLGLTHAAITLRCVTHQGHRHLLLVNDERDLQLAAAGRVEEFFISSQEVAESPFEHFVAAQAFSLSLNFKQPQGQPQRLGYLVAQVGPDTSLSQAQVNKELTLVADEIIRTIGRYQTRYRAIHIYGDQSYWVGNSKALRQLDQRIDLLAKGSKPVLIRADKGCGKVIAARSLHCLSRTDTAPFIESDCREWEADSAVSILQSLHTFARGGSLFIRNIDALSDTDFKALRSFWLKVSKLSFDGVESLRLIMSLSSENAPLGGAQSQWLAQHTQELRLPNLAERRDDVRDLAQFYIRELALGAELDLTEEAWQLLEATESLADVEQLKAVIQKLSLLADGVLVSADELRQELELG